MTRDELIWAAGFYDGEGSTFWHKATNQIIMCVSQKAKGPLKRFMEAVGEGNIYGPYGNRPCAEWKTSGNGAERALFAMWPYMSDPKREQASECVLKWQNKQARYT